jgi:hypothetical protein
MATKNTALSALVLNVAILKAIIEYLMIRNGQLV